MEIKDLEKLLSEMSLEEKVGQMVQIPANMLTEGGLITGPTDSIEMTKETASLVGSVLGKAGAENLREMQDNFMKKHPHHIPLLLMFDVINGMETIYPIPLAQGCTFSEELVEAGAKMAAREGTAKGLHVTFSPMLDLVRDARWGRVMESTGEDPWLNAQLGKAMVRGYQGASVIAGEKIDLCREGNIAGCIKHFAGYGAPEGGRDYENVELSERTFREDYLPAYQAAVEEGCVMLMTSFNSLNRIPSSGNQWLMRKVLREEMGFEGVVISDYSAVDEMINHGIAQDSKEAAKLAILAGVDIDMVSNAYVKYLAELVQEGEVPMALVDEAVMRILKLKNDLGLFENPYKDGSAEKEKEWLGCAKHRALAREMAAASFVLLKNEGILPLQKDEKVAFIGPYTDNVEMFGSWSFPTNPETVVTIRKGVEAKGVEALWAKGCYMQDKGQNTRYGKQEEYDNSEKQRLLKEAIEIASKVDRIVLCLGEHRDHSGEAGSRANICLPENQMTLVRELCRVNPHIVSVVFSGRPLVIKELAELSEAVCMVWMPGTEGGNAIADVLYGDVLPQGRLSMSMPRSVGQVPIYYNRFRTGRPNIPGDAVGFVHGYIDESVKPLYPFGYGLSYTKFEYSGITLNSKVLACKTTEDTEESGRDELLARVMVTNVGEYAGTETVQMYLRDVKGSVIRPVKMLRGIQKVNLQPGESKEVSFVITEEMLRFYNIDMQFVSEPGTCQVFIGPDSDTENMAEFELR